jgi:hypothetical protein
VKNHVHNLLEKLAVENRQADSRLPNRHFRPLRGPGGRVPPHSSAPESILNLPIHCNAGLPEGVWRRTLLPEAKRSEGWRSHGSGAMC